MDEKELIKELLEELFERSNINISSSEIIDNDGNTFIKIIANNVNSSNSYTLYKYLCDFGLDTNWKTEPVNRWTYNRAYFFYI